MDKDIKDENLIDDFKDFNDSDEKISPPELEEDLIEDDSNKETKDNDKIEPQEEIQQEEEKKEEKKEKKQEETAQTEINQWEEVGDDNSVVKKYIFYISKAFTPYIDNLTQKERTAYINDAIQKKLDFESEKKQKEAKRRLFIHTFLMVAVFIFFTPFALLGVNKAIMLTFENYKYSQDNFEKLYKQRFKNSKTYTRSVEYNKMHSSNKN